MSAPLRLTDIPQFADAECATLDSSEIDTFFFGGERQPKHEIAIAKEICFRCVSRLDCLTFALTHHEKHGVWGGLTEVERYNLDRRNRRAAQKEATA
jgi:WhiB family redox-sensing transcriptional regulator